MTKSTTIVPKEVLHGPVVNGGDLVSQSDPNDPLYDSQSEPEGVADEESDSYYSVLINPDGITRKPLFQSPSAYSICASSTEGSPALSVEQFEEQLKEILEEFAVEPKISDAAQSIQELKCCSYHDLLVVRAIRFSLDRDKDVQADTSSLITYLYDSRMVSRPQIMRAFEKCVQAVNDWSLDVPFAHDKLLVFFECAVEDGVAPSELSLILPEKFLRSLSPEIYKVAPWLLEQADSLKKSKQAAEVACREFLTSADWEGFQQYISKLDVDNADLAASTIVRSESRGNLTKLSGATGGSSSNLQAAAAAGGAPSPVPTPTVIKSTDSCFRHELVRILLRVSMDLRNKNRELASQALNKLYGMNSDQLAPQDIQLGVARLLADVEDMSLDVPAVFEYTSKFIVRMIVDEVIPPSFVGDFLRLHLGGRGGMDVLRRVRRWSYEYGQHRVLSERVQKIWLESDDIANTEVLEFKRMLRDIIFSYFDTRDLDLSILRVRTLSMSPDQEAECVRKIIQFAMERSRTEFDLGVNMLNGLVSENEIELESVALGIDQLKSKAPDLKIDIPRLDEHMKDFFIPTLIGKSLLPSEYQWVQY